MFPDQIIECSILQGIRGICIAELTQGNFWYIIADSWSLRTQTSRYSGKHFLFPSYFLKTVETNYLLLQSLDCKGDYDVTLNPAFGTNIHNVLFTDIYTVCISFCMQFQEFLTVQSMFLQKSNYFKGKNS